MNIPFFPWNVTYLFSLSATYSTGFALSCQICTAGFKCPNHQTIEQCPVGSYSTATGKCLLSYYIIENYFILFNVKEQSYIYIL